MKLTKTAKLRIAVAKDVLASLGYMKAKRANGYVVRRRAGSNKLLKGTDSKKIAQKLKKECTVCAKGALLLSLVYLKNDFNFAEANGGWYNDNSSGISIGPDKLKARLVPTFSQNQIDDIEDYFEYQSEYEKISPKKALKAIMENIIENRGTFCNPQRIYRPFWR